MNIGSVANSLNRHSKFERELVMGSSEGNNEAIQLNGIHSRQRLIWHSRTSVVEHLFKKCAQLPICSKTEKYFL